MPTTSTPAMFTYMVATPTGAVSRCSRKVYTHAVVRLNNTGPWFVNMATSEAHAMREAAVGVEYRKAIAVVRLVQDGVTDLESATWLKGGLA